MSNSLEQAPVSEQQSLAGSSARRVAANAVNPFAAQIVTKVLMMGYLIVQYRLIEGAQLGEYLIAALLFTYTSTIADWGLSTLVTRDVAKVRGTEHAAELTSGLFWSTLAVRLLVSLGLVLPVGIVVAAYVQIGQLGAAGIWAVLLLTLSLLPGTLASSVSSLLYAYERMSLPAGIGIATSFLNVALGVGFLLLGWGIVGLALAASIATFVTALIFWRILGRDFPWVASRPRVLRLPRSEVFSLLKAGWPLMLNALLVTLFFRIDQFIIYPVQGGLAVAQYGAAYSFLNFILLITPAVTLALFPRMARHAATDRPRLAYEYTFALKVLLILAVPLVVLTIWFAPLLVSVLTGFKPGYLPASAQALQILILFLPFSFINGVTQYVLISLDLQRLITRAFGVTLVFNLAANLLLVPIMGINGAALTTILSELVLMGPFLVWTGRELGPVPLASIAWKPALAGLVSLALSFSLGAVYERWSVSWLDFALYALVGVGLLLLSLLALFFLSPFAPDERRMLMRAVRPSHE